MHKSIAQLRKCIDCPVMIKGTQGGNRCKPCQADFFDKESNRRRNERRRNAKTKAASQSIQ